jgi:RNA polymerase sigma-70 factor (ECF subfamily)
MLDRIDALYRSESRRVLATLIRLLGDFDLAEEALQDAFAAAVQRWPVEGEPAKPLAWLVSAGRFKAIDRLRRRRAFDARLPAIADELERGEEPPQDVDPDEVEDDRLRMIFTCCHPALAIEAQIPLTLRTVCGLTTEEIARAYLVPAPTLAQRIVRAKSKIRDAGIPYEVPSGPALAERLDAVLHVIYLVFNEGYLASFGETVTRADLASEAIRLGRLLVALLPEGEARGLLALMLLHDSRREARMRDAEPVLLEDQDRTLWDREQIVEGLALVRQALSSNRFGPYTIQAAIAAVHAESTSPDVTDWRQIAGLYDVLYRAVPTPVVELNRAAAVAMALGYERGLALIDALLARGELTGYQHAHAARADLLRRLGRRDEARQAYEQTLSLTSQEPERRYLTRRIAEWDSWRVAGRSPR